MPLSRIIFFQNGAGIESRNPHRTRELFCTAIDGILPCYINYIFFRLPSSLDFQAVLTTVRSHSNCFHLDG